MSNKHFSLQLFTIKFNSHRIFLNKFCFNIHMNFTKPNMYTRKRVIFLYNIDFQDNSNCGNAGFTHKIAPNLRKLDENKNSFTALFFYTHHCTNKLKIILTTLRMNDWFLKSILLFFSSDLSLILVLFTVKNVYFTLE